MSAQMEPPAKEQRAANLIERVMTQHWDMAACRCWFCQEGRELGYRPRECYLHAERLTERGT